MRDELLKRVGIEEADLTETELAELEQLSVRTIREWRQKGTGPPYRKLGPGKMAPVRYPVAAYRAWREQNLVNSTAERTRTDLAGRR
jgi:predicted DNA-binding transcriptional regulator AlpA